MIDSTIGPSSTGSAPRGASHNGTESTAPGGAGVNFVFLVIYLAGLSAFGSFVNDMYLPSLPSMCDFFHCQAPTVQLGLTFGMIGLGLGEVILGPVSAKYGRKPVLVVTIIIFIVACIVSIYSPTIHFFIWCRLFQGVGASGGYFLARTIPADFYGGRMLAKTMAIIGAINGIAPASAPVIGGFISDAFTWKGTFWALAIFATALLAFSPKLKESLPKSRRSTGSLLSTFGRYGQLARNRRFMIHVLLKGTALGFLFAYISSAPFIVQTHFKYSQVVFGCIMGANAVFVAAGSMLALRFKVLKRAAFVGGIGVMALTLVEFAMLRWGDSFWAYEIPMVCLLFCLGMIFTVSNTLAMNEGRANAGGASALLGLAGYVFGAIVSPLVGIGNVMHSTAWAFLALGVMVLASSLLSKRVPADLGPSAGSPAADSASGAHSELHKTK